MASRAERIDEAFELTEGFEILLETLSLNEIPLRRVYFNAVTDIQPEKVVKILAKLANAGMLAETDGLLFGIESKEIAREIRERIEPERRRQIHEDSLAWAVSEDDVDPRFLFGHRLGAERLDEALATARDQLAEEEDPFRARAWCRRLREAVDAFLEKEPDRSGLILDGAKLFIERGGRDMKPRALSKLITRLKELEIDEAQRAELDALEERVKTDRKAAEKAKAQAEAEARAAEAAAVTSDVSDAESATKKSPAGSEGSDTAAS